MRKLTENEELLLCKFHDRECKWLEGYKAKRLLKSNEEARAYMENLSRSGSLVREAVYQDSYSQGPADLWTRISVRLHQEDKAVGVLGQSLSQGRVAESWTRFWPVLVGAACAGIMAIVLVPSMGKNGQKMASNSDKGFVSSESIRIVDKRTAHSVSVDWMKSDGQVVMMHDSQESAPILFVKKRDPRVLTARTNRRVIAVGGQNSSRITIPNRDLE